MPDASFRAFLGTSFALLEREAAWAYVGFCRQLAPRTVRLAVDGEALGLRFGSQAVAFEPPPDAATITIATSHATILAVVDAEATLMSAVLDGTLELQGAPEDLLAFHDGLMVYLHGAVRSPSFPGLLRRYRAGAPPEGHA